MAIEDSDSQPSSPSSDDDERVYDQIMRDRRFAEALLDADTRHPELTRPYRDLHALHHKLPYTGWTTSPPIRKRKGGDSPRASQPNVSMTDQTDEEAEFEMYMIQGNLREWVIKDKVRCFIAKKFKDFLLSYVEPENENGYFKYVRLINEMVQANHYSLEIDFNELRHIHSKIAMCLQKAPHPVLEVMEEVAEKVVFNVHPNAQKNHQKIVVRVTNLPVNDQIRELGQFHLNTMIHISGIVTRRYGISPQLYQVIYDCNKCGVLLGPFFRNSCPEVEVGSCSECKSKGPFTFKLEHTIYRNYQRLTIQESPGTVRAGRLPRHVEVILLGDLIDCASPGEEIEVTGIYTNNFDISFDIENGIPVYATVVEANYVRKKQEKKSKSYPTN